MRPDGPQTGQTARLGGTENVGVCSSGNPRAHIVTSTPGSAAGAGSASTCAKQSPGSNTHRTPSCSVIGSVSRR